MSAPGDLSVLEARRADGISFIRRPAAPAAPALLFLHGIGSSAQSWAGVLSRIAPEFEAIAWDAPGYGGSEDLAEDWPTPADFARRVLDLLDALSLTRVLLVGHSLGSLFAGAFAAAFPGRTVALVLFSPALGYRLPRGATLTAPLQARLDSLAQLGAEAFAARSAPRLVARPETRPEVVARVTEIMSRVRPVGYARAVRALGCGDLLGDAARIEAQALVAVGESDTVTPPENARRLHAALAHPDRLIEIAGAGHAAPQEDPAAVAQIVNSFARVSVHVPG